MSGEDELRPEVAAILAQMKEETALREKYRIDGKLTFFSPGSRPDDLGNICPICRCRTPTSARYAGYVCESCVDRAVDGLDRPIRFYNEGPSGGCVAQVLATGEQLHIDRFFIDGRACVAGEARFGGIVHQLADGGQSKDDPSRNGNKLAERVTGAVLGAAVGDAMGYPTESIRTFDELQRRFGPSGVEGYALLRDEGGRRVAPYTGDTQLAELVLVSVLDARAAKEPVDAAMQRFARALVQWARAPQAGHRAPGRASLNGAAALERGVPWREAGAPDSGGSGSVTRAYPLGLVFHSDTEAREAWVVAQSALTHRAPIALAACSAMAHATASALAGDSVEETVRIAADSARRHDRATAAMIEAAAKAAHAGEPRESVLGRLLGWAAHEAIAAAVYVFVRHPDDFRAAVLEAANTPGDSNGIAALAGALVGARAGVHSIPADWIRDLERSNELSALAARTLAESDFVDWDGVLDQFEAIRARR